MRTRTNMMTMTTRKLRLALAHVSGLALMALLTVAATAGCDQGGIGDRCNVNLHNDVECNDGLTCQQPGTCSQAYCCPEPATSSTNPNCVALAECEAAAADASTDAAVPADADGADSG